MEAALEVAGRLESGTVWINDWHMVILGTHLFSRRVGSA
jgi:acyl-CoA reductase-like NAD-dependent aldehyde dehydrogenase